MFTLIAPPGFLRQARKFLDRHPELRPRFTALLDTLRRDPFHPALKLHALGGKLSGCHAVTLTHSPHVTLTILISAKEITLLAIAFQAIIHRAQES